MKTMWWRLGLVVGIVLIPTGTAMIASYSAYFIGGTMYGMAIFLLIHRSAHLANPLL